MNDRCDAGPACPHFAGYLPLGDHGWYHRRRPDCPTVTPAQPTGQMTLPFAELFR